MKYIKKLVDAYDGQVSGLANDLDDIQEAVLVASGTTSKPEQVRDNAKKFKCVVVPEGGELTALEITIPHEAKQMLLDKMEKNIAGQGMAIDVNREHFGNLSGVELKFL